MPAWRPEKQRPRRKPKARPNSGRSTLSIRVPLGTKSMLEEVARLAHVTVDQLVSVIIATKIVKDRTSQRAGSAPGSGAPALGAARKRRTRRS